MLSFFLDLVISDAGADKQLHPAFGYLVGLRRQKEACTQAQAQIREDLPVSPKFELETIKDAYVQCCKHSQIRAETKVLYKLVLSKWLHRVTNVQAEEIDRIRHENEPERRKCKRTVGPRREIHIQVEGGVQSFRQEEIDVCQDERTQLLVDLVEREKTEDTLQLVVQR